jgi:hypothetical protein
MVLCPSTLIDFTFYVFQITAEKVLFRGAKQYYLNFIQP